MAVLRPNIKTQIQEYFSIAIRGQDSRPSLILTDFVVVKTQDRNFNDESKSSENIGGSDLGRNRLWKGKQQLSGEGIQIVVDHVDRSDDQRRQPLNSRHGKIFFVKVSVN